MSPPYNAPVEIWYQVLQSLPLSAVASLSAATSKCHAICKHELDQRKRLKYDTFDTEAFRRWDQFPLHSLLLSILRGGLDACYIKALDCGTYCERAKQGQDDRFPLLAAQERHVLSAADRRLVLDSQDAAPWLDGLELVDEIDCGDEHAVIAMLVPLLHNLRSLRIPLYAAWLPEVLGRIACMQVQGPAASAGSAHQVSTTAPLTKLILVITSQDEGDGISLEVLANFLAIASVQRVFTACVRNEHSVWPDHLPLSNASEVYFYNSSIAAVAIESLARGFRHPCKLRQYYNVDTPGEFHERDWDHCTILPDVKDPSVAGRVVVEMRTNDDFFDK